MAFGITGYLLEPPRVGAGNSPYTAGPNNVISDQSAWDVAYPTDESNPASSYLVLVVGGKLPDAKFGWAKNETIPRFDYDAARQRFWPLPGASAEEIGTLALDSNSSRLSVPLLRSDDIVSFPIRVSLAQAGASGTTMAVVVVSDDAFFTPSPGPAAGTVELSLDSGNLNWADADLVAYQGRTVQFQRQVPRNYAESSGALGSIEDVLLMSPIPATGQTPLIRVGSRLWWSGVEVADEASFTNPPTGTFQWARDTGRLRFNTSDTVTFGGSTVFYDGVLLETGLQLPTQTCGTVAAPTLLTPVPSEGGDFVVRLVGTDTYQMRYVTLVDDFPSNLNEIQPPDVQIRKSDGAFAFNPLQTALRGAHSLVVTTCDLPVDHGVSLRLFRCPVDLQATNADLKDVTTLYEATGAVFASPIIGTPQVFLPAEPLEDSPMTVKVEQGTGFFVSDDLPNLRDLMPTGSRVYGYLIDLGEGVIRYAQRRNDYVINRTQPSGSVQLPDGYVQDFNRTVEMEQTAGAGDWQLLDLTTDAYIEPLSGVITFTDTKGELLASGQNASISGTTLTSPGASFTPALVNKWVVLPTEGAVYGVVAVPTPQTLTLDAAGSVAGPTAYEVRDYVEVLADRYFEDVLLMDPDTKFERILPLGTITNAPHYIIQPAWIDKVRFRYADGSYSTTVTLVTGAFTNPSLMAAGTVEINETSGEVNFAQDDVDAGGTVYWVRALRQGVDYKVTAELGFVEFTERFFTGEEGLITYKPSDSDVFVEEPMRFLVRKELTAPRSAPTSIIEFNPDGHAVADDPAPQVFRGGRPQTSSQVSVDTQHSKVTFLVDKRLDGLLPHGPIVNPTENVYVDYYILDAVGGEKTVSVLRPPMVMAQVRIEAGETSFDIVGNWISEFKANRILRIDAGEVHYIQSVVYDLTEAKTTVTISSGETFRDDWTAPAVAIASGPTRLTGSLFEWAYFTSDLGRFNPVPRGTNKIIFDGNRTGDYEPGTVMRVTSGTDVEMTLVDGSSYDSTEDTTEVVLATNTLRQYVWGLVTVQRTVRPIVDASSTTVQTSNVPVPAGDAAVPTEMTNVQVFRKVEGEPGVLLTGMDYYMDPSGRVIFYSPLQPDEQWGIFYTGHDIVEAGRRVRASYVSVISPDFTNGIAGQNLTADYWTFSPDSFFYRVVKISEYRLELAAKYAQAARESAPSGGPLLSNASSPTLYQQGSPSPYYYEGVYANDDVVTRYLLKFYNDLVNHLEDILQGMDGRIVGGRDGRFLFDGNIDNPLRPPVPTDPFVWDDVTNQVDDRIKIADAPYQINFSFPNFSITPLGTYVAAYLPNAYSRFYPTWRRRYGVTGVGVETGDPVLDTGSTNLTSVQNLRTRLAWAQVTQEALTGTTVLFVDNAEGASEAARPPFRPDMEVVVQDRDGTVLIAAGDHVAIAAGGVATTSLTLNAALTVDIPVGATVYRSPEDPSGAGPDEVIMNYMIGRDYSYNPTTGQILYIVPFPPYDGSNPLVPAPLEAQPLPAGVPLSMEVTLGNQAQAPEKIPALYGRTSDDDGEERLPLVGPDLICEETTFGVGLLASELEFVEAGGLLRTATTAPYELTGSLDVTRTIITVTPGFIQVPQQYDLVRILTGLNGETSFHRVVSATPTTVTVEHPFDFQDSGFTCLVATSPSMGTGTGTFASDTLTDGAALFQTWGVQPGDTVVVESGAGAGRRLQVVEVLGQTSLRYETALTASGNYRVTNPLSTFGSISIFTGDSLLDQLIDVLVRELQVVDSRTTPINSEVTATEEWFDLVFTYLVIRIGGSFTTGTTTFTDPGADFEAAGVAAGDVVYIRSGVTIKGVYQINDVTSPTTLEVDQTFPDTASGIAYKVGRPYGASFTALETVMDTLRLADEFVTQTMAFFTLLLTPVDVVVTGGGTDPDAFARATRTQDLNLREAVVGFRQTDLANPSGPKEDIVQVLSSDLLYDKRYAWLDARINRQTGLLTQKSLAVQQRLEAQAQAVLQMVKLLSMGSL